MPEAASTLLLQEEKFKFYFAQLLELVSTHTSMHIGGVGLLSAVCTSQG